MIPTVKIRYARTDSLLAPGGLDRFMRALSCGQQAAVGRYVRREDRCRALLGRILIRELLKAFGFDARLLGKIRFTAYRRPYLDLPLDFNLAHSGNLVVCAGSLDCRVGIDIEKIKDIDYHPFRPMLTDGEWRRIRNAGDPRAEFFRTWVRKESVAKADGRGLFFPFDQLETNFQIVAAGEAVWHLTDLDHWSGYAACLAGSRPGLEMDIRRYDLPLEMAG